MKNGSELPIVKNCSLPSARFFQPCNEMLFELPWVVFHNCEDPFSGGAFNSLFCPGAPSQRVFKLQPKV